MSRSHQLEYTPRPRLGVPLPKSTVKREQRAAFLEREREYLERAKADHARQRAAVLARLKARP